MLTCLGLKSFRTALQAGAGLETMDDVVDSPKKAGGNFGVSEPVPRNTRERAR